MTKPYSKPKVCKDCILEFGVKLASTRPRTTFYPGPRCTTHHRDFIKARKQRTHELMVTKTYGIEAGEYEKRYKAQGGTCAICQRATGATKRLAVDHNHRTGSVRGLLCGPCNQFVGRLRDSPEAFLRAHKYLLSKLEYNYGDTYTTGP